MVRFGRRMERSRPRARFSGALQAAAAAVLLVAGGLIGRALAPGGSVDAPGGRIATSSAGSQFLLLLRGEEPDRTRPAERLVEEYGAWAGRLAEAGVLVSAEALDSTSRWVPGEAVTDPGSTSVSGYFLVQAPSDDSAVAIARASPHVRYGGLVEIRRIRRTP
jgi:hypothetical protein